MLLRRRPPQHPLVGEMVETMTGMLSSLSECFAKCVRLIAGFDRFPIEIKPLVQAMTAFARRDFIDVRIVPLSEVLQSTDPHLVQAVWDKIFKNRKLKIEVPIVPYSSELIKSEANKGRCLIFIPEEYTLPSRLRDLLKLFPEFSSSIKHQLWCPPGIEGVFPRPYQDPSGWIFVENNLNPPSANKTVDQMVESFDNSCWSGFIGINAFVFFWQWYKLVYLEQPEGRDYLTTCHEFILGTNSDHSETVRPLLVTYNLPEVAVQIDINTLDSTAKRIYLGARRYVKYDPETSAILPPTF